MSAQRSFHILMLVLSLCLLSSEVTKVAAKSEYGAVLKPDRSLISVQFWKDVVKDAIKTP